MIIFYNKKTGQIFATIDGRVHSSNQMKITISQNDLDKKDIRSFVVGYIEDENGNRKEHNMHLWKYQLDFEDPKNSRSATKCRIVEDKNGNISDIKDS